MYLTVVGWQSNSLEVETQTELINELTETCGKPGIINSDQGSQYTSGQWISCLKEHQIGISMDGKGRAIDNAFIERFFRSIKYDYIYLSPTRSGIELYQGIKKYVKRYNNRKYQGSKLTKTNKPYILKTKFNSNQLDSGLKNRGSTTHINFFQYKNKREMKMFSIKKVLLLFKNKFFPL